MKFGKVTEQSSRNFRVNLSHTIEGNKTKLNNNHTDTQEHTAAAAKIIIIQHKS